MLWKLTTLFLSSIAVVNFPFIPMRPVLMVFYFSKDINFLLVALISVLGTTIGVLPTYGISYKASEIAKVKKWLKIKWIKKILDPIKHNMFLVIILINISPLPDVLIGVLGGTEKYPFKKFVFANLLGRTIFYLPFAFGGMYFAGDTQMFEEWVRSLLASNT